MTRVLTNKGTALFAMAFHCYQPVFNLEDIVEEAYQKAYKPLLDTFGEFSGIKATFHFSGNMLEWLETKHPAYIDRLRRLADRGSIEILGGGYYEPVMTVIPERDRLGQLERTSALLHKIFGIRPRGAWLSEKVWKPELAETYRRAGIEYTIVDDHHLMLAGASEEDIRRPCMTGSNGSRLVLFPALTRFRYSMPFRPAEVTIGHMKRLSGKGRTCFFFGDDGEKFGAWPYTYGWVHKSGWLRGFFNKLEENRDWLRTCTYSEVLDSVGPVHIPEVPDASYAEMMEWSGGNFLNFMDKYPEAGRMHSRMCSLSDRIDGAPDGPHLEQARTALYKAQTNCPYWHGTFGGIYLPHLRAGVYRHLIEAENILEGKEHVPVRQDNGYGGRGETVLGADNMRAFISPFHGGSVTEIDHTVSGSNLLDLISRTEERYHSKLRRGCLFRASRARKAIARGEFPDVHEVLGIGQRNIRRGLRYDDHVRRSFLTHLLDGDRPLDLIAKGRTGHEGFLKGAYYPEPYLDEGMGGIVLTRRGSVNMDDGTLCGIKVVKRIGATDEGFDLSQEVSITDGEAPRLECGSEFNFGISDPVLKRRPQRKITDKLEIRDEYSGILIKLRLEERCRVLTYPVFTVNETESGLRRTLQGICAVIFSDSKSLDGEALSKIRIKLRVE